MSPAATDDSHDDAVIKLLDENLEPGDDEITVQFNPGELSVDKSVTFAEQSIPGLDSPIQQFVSGDAETLSLELFFDVYEERDTDQPDDVRDLTDEVNRLLLVDGELHAPPIVRFAWGTIAFTAVVQSANTTFTMFRADGTPVRARMDLTFLEYTPPAEQLQGEPRHSADRTSVRRLIEGDTLPAIAGEEYGQPERWRRIADANDIENPRRLQPGAELVIPVLERS